MKVIFLDIDGVLNIMCDEQDEFGHLFHKQFEENLKDVIDNTGAKIVISSTWRRSGLKAMKAMWFKRDLAGEVIDVTPDCAQLKTFGTLEYYEAKERGYEIQEWLDSHSEVTNYVIFDDDNDMLESQRPNFVRCSGKKEPDSIDVGYGLTKKRALKAIEILNKAA